MPEPRLSSGVTEQGFCQRLEDVGLEPVFIMGPHRSGTTILYKVLAETGCFNLTTAYHVLNRDALLSLHESGKEPAARAELVERLEQAGAIDRRFDSVSVSPDTPEEYAYALDYQGRRPILSPRNLPGFLRFCRKVQHIQDGGRLLLLKNPFDASNFLYIKDAVPGSRFVFIHRHPAQVISSQIRAVRSLLSADNPYVALVVARYRRLISRPRTLALTRYLFSERLPILLHLVSRTVTRGNRFFLNNVHRLPDCHLDVTYDELCQAPSSTVTRILDFLDREELGKTDYERLIRAREMELLPEVQRRLDSIQKQNQDYCSRFGLAL